MGWVVNDRIGANKYFNEYIELRDAHRNLVGGGGGLVLWLMMGYHASER